MGIAAYWVGLVAGLAILAWSADIFVGGSAALARRMGMSKLVVGMVVIGFGTSAPEMLVSVLSAIEGSPSMALGNAYGSCTANIALILGLSAALAPVMVAKSVVRRELPILLFATAASWVIISNGVVARLEAFELLAIFAVGMFINIRFSRPEESAGPDDDKPPMALGKATIMTLAGFLLLVGSSRLLVVSAIAIARALGVSDLFIGLTIVAIGTSLPELASAIAAVRRREHDLVTGNIIGSNLFNTLCVVGLACAISPMNREGDAETIRLVSRRDFPFVGLTTLLLAASCIPFRRGVTPKLSRPWGFLLMALYIAYLAILLRQG